MTLLTLGAGLLLATPALAVSPPAKETSCSDRKDEDNDGLADCGDADCKGDPACEPDGKPENTDERCSDWVDNDGDGHVDCYDDDCNRGTVKVCKGSWTGPLEGGDVGMTNSPPDEAMPELGPGQTVEDLIGKHGDIDGERNDVDCSDGIDNDGDGRIDCADYGCRFDKTVRVCQGSPGMRFSVVASIGGSYDLMEEKANVSFNKLQLRSFGPIPFVQDSFYLLSMRAEKSPRLTFAMFQVPLGGGHFININSGSGGLSRQLVLSSAKQLLLNPPYYLLNAFEQRNSAALEVGGPVDLRGIVKYRAYASGGAGFSTGNVGGTYFDANNGDEFTWGAGASFLINVLGRFSEWDSQFLYTAAPLAVAVKLGAKYDDRVNETYVAMNAAVYARWKWLSFAAENYSKREFDFESWQTAYNVRLGVLLWPQHLTLGADVGEFIAFDPAIEPNVTDRDLRRQLNEFQWRVALHWYWYRNVGVATLLYTDREIEPSTQGQIDPDRERSLLLNVQYRF